MRSCILSNNPERHAWHDNLNYIFPDHLLPLISSDMSVYHLFLLWCLHGKTRPTLERRKTLGHLRSINPNMINHYANQSQTCQLLKILKTFFFQTKKMSRVVQSISGWTDIENPYRLSRSRIYIHIYIYIYIYIIHYIPIGQSQTRICPRWSSNISYISFAKSCIGQLADNCPI